MKMAASSAAWYVSVLALGAHQGVFLYMAVSHCLHAAGLKRGRQV